MRIAIVFDLDHTLFNSTAFFDEKVVEWNGMSQMWLDLCTKLEKLGKQLDVQIFFGIVTGKSFVDDLVCEAVSVLKNFLLSLHVNRANNSAEYFRLVNDNNEWPVCISHVNYAYLPQGPCFPVQAQSSVHLTSHAYKSSALESLRQMFGIEKSNNVLLIDDSDIYCAEVKKKGFSYISAKSINEGENTWEQRRKQTEIVINAVLENVKNKINEMKYEYLQGLIQYEFDQTTKAKKIEIRRMIRSFIKTAKLSNEKLLLENVLQKQPEMITDFLDNAMVDPADVLQIQPHHACAHYRVGLDAFKKYDYQLAIKSLSKALQFDPGNERYRDSFHEMQAVAALMKASTLHRRAQSFFPAPEANNENQRIAQEISVGRRVWKN